MHCQSVSYKPFILRSHNTCCGFCLHRVPDVTGYERDATRRSGTLCYNRIIRDSTSRQVGIVDKLLRSFAALGTVFIKDDRF
jgi:hypothetical protein